MHADSLQNEPCCTVGQLVAVDLGVAHDHCACLLLLADSCRIDHYLHTSWGLDTTPLQSMPVMSITTSKIGDERCTFSMILERLSNRLKRSVRCSGIVRKK